MPRPLQLHSNTTAPFRPTFLSIPPSPITPLTPMQIPSLPSRPHLTRTTTSPPPPSPLQWVWQCHQCRRTYALGVTRRCLEDGHVFCSGTTLVKQWRTSRHPKRVKRKHGACASEFDYVGWKAWGCWRRRQEIVRSVWEDSSSSDESSTEEDEVEEVAQVEEPADVKDCWNNCDYPSECRWGKRFGVRTPTTPERPAVPTAPTVASSSSRPGTSEGVLKMENVNDTAKKNIKDETFWGALMASATRRNRSTPSSSPLALASVPEEPEKETGKDEHGDTVMPPPPPSTPSAITTTLSAIANSPIKVKEMIMNTCTRGSSSSSSSKPQKQRRNAMALSSPSEGNLNLEFDFGFEGEKGGEEEKEESERKKSRKSGDSGYGSLLDELRVGRI